MIRTLLAWLALTAAAAAQTPTRTQTPAPEIQNGIGPTGTMFDGNNLIRFPLAPPPRANPAPSPATATPGVTGAQGSRDESGSGAGGGEH